MWTRVAGAGDVGEGEMLALKVDGHLLALYHVSGAWFCTDNVCTHAFAILTEGWLEEHLVECPLHSGQFDIRTGKGCSAPITQDLRTYPVRTDGEDVLVDFSVMVLDTRAG